MKKYLMLILSILLLIITFIYNWFSDQLLDLLFVYILIPNFVLFIAFIICFVLNIRKFIMQKNAINFSSLIVSIIIILLVLFFPFREIKTRLEFNLYIDKRNQVIELIKNNKINVNDYNNAPLPDNLKDVSMSGEVYVYQNDENDIQICFWILRGLLSNSTELIYSSGGEELIRSNINEESIVNIKKIKNNWYYVITDY